MTHGFRFACSTAIAFGIVCSPAFAADRAPTHPPVARPPVCKPLDKIKSDLGATTHFATLTPGQFHFAAGLYVGSPTTPDGLPPGDGALLVTHDGADGAMILWVNGKNGCGPISIPGKLVAMLKAMGTGPGEILNDDASEERKL